MTAPRTDGKETTAVATYATKPAATPQDLKAFLERNMSSIQAVAAAAITPERMVKIACAAASRNPYLAKCTPLSILRALVQGAELGLEPASGLGEAHLVPYWNNQIKAYEAQFIPDFRGLAKLARQSGEVLKIEARVVHDKDDFAYQYGLKPDLTHKPALDEAGDVKAFYAIAWLTNGEEIFEVMSKTQVDGIRGRSKAKDNGPWVTDYEEMGRKTAVRRLSKYLPKSQQLAKALEIQAKHEAGDFTLDTDLEVFPDGDAPAPEPTTKTEALKQELLAQPASTIETPSAAKPAPEQAGLLPLDDKQPARKSAIREGH